MAIVKPFRAVRPIATLAEKVASLPYDVMNSREARVMAAGNPYSFLHVSRAEIDLPEMIDEHSNEVYEKAKSNFDRLIQEGTLVQDETAYYYIYSQVMAGRRQTGLVACSSVEDYFNNIIKKHEFTRPEKEEDRIRHMEVLSAHVGPIFLTYKANRSVDSLIENWMNSHQPVYNFTADDGVQHTVWVIDNNDTIEIIQQAFEKDVPFTYIADGHHRTASAAKVGKRLQQTNENHTGEEEYNFFLSVLFPDTQLAIMDYNRAVKDLNGHTIESFLESVKKWFDVEPTGFEDCKPRMLHEYAMYLSRQWYRLRAKETIIKQDPIGVLDVTILQENLLAPLLGIEDPRTDKRIDFIGGIRGLGELQKRVDSGEMAVAFALYPVSLKQLMDIADSGNVMPPKSTWFEPKLRDGLFCHLF